MPEHGEEFLQATMPAADLVHNLARRLTTSRSDAEDLVQETYTRAWVAWQDQRRPARVEPWLATICLNLNRDRLGRASTRYEARWDEAFDPPGTVDVEAEVLGRLDHAVVDAALRGLPEEQRIAITLMDLCGFTAAEVAGITGAPRGTVLARVHRGRKRLAESVRKVNRHAP
ncbi:RNA polymerase sigma factor [Amycolatopsis aidingensis]|uniref:RNA polymerase sigma factor n=1 Tax=Amycolatopsis aidingensis TaxID=2842453 RepID=UPI001C0D0B54|nr:sigma-70 family RNA polymerase sigma factor [Amycolatopsis aidingensis]